MLDSLPQKKHYNFTINFTELQANTLSFQCRTQSIATMSSLTDANRQYFDAMAGTYDMKDWWAKSNQNVQTFLRGRLEWVGLSAEGVEEGKKIKMLDYACGTGLMTRVRDSYSSPLFPSIVLRGVGRLAKTLTPSDLRPLRLQRHRHRPRARHGIRIQLTHGRSSIQLVVAHFASPCRRR